MPVAVDPVRVALMTPLMTCVQTGVLAARDDRER